MTAIPPIVALKGAATSGKSTAANWIIRNHTKAIKLSFARPLKRMVYELIRDVLPKNWPITPTEYINNSELKESPIPFLANQTPRRLMQTLGTEWGRNAIHPDFWTDIAAARIENTLGSAYQHAPGNPLKIVFDDCRFPNEGEMVRRYGGIVVEIRRPGVTSVGLPGHASERQDFPADLVIDNDGTVEDLEARLAALFPAPQKA